jgi:hypothetical protein
MALSGVKCAVDSCQYWRAPNLCDAPNIEVDINHSGLAAETGAGRGAGARGAGMEVGEVGVYRRGAVEREGAYEMGDLDIGAAARAVEPAGRPTARRAQHTCCRTFRPRG